MFLTEVQNVYNSKVLFIAMKQRLSVISMPFFKVLIQDFT